GSRLLRKGAVLDEAALARWGDIAPGVVHLLELAPDDVHEDPAGLRVAIAVAGDGIRIKGPIQSRYNLVSERKGLLRVNIELVHRCNSVDGVTLFTLLDRQPVLPGKIVAGVKVTPIAVPEANLVAVENIVRDAGAFPLAVHPFLPKRVSVVATEGLNERMRARFREVVERKIRWYGSELLDLRFVESEPGAVATALQDFIDAGSDILMAAGGNTLDPLDPIIVALAEIGGEMVHFGAPSHPGSMFWLAKIGERPVVNLASCSMYSRATVADLILPLVMTGQRVTSADIINLGYGGLLEREMAFRFPNYEAELSHDEDEDEG
ncbi:MAG: hypothetical protein DCC58_15985, partial [Chloroflexi bacterium]